MTSHIVDPEKEEFVIITEEILKLVSNLDFQLLSIDYLL